MSTTRLAGKKIDDVLYPKITPYQTGMLKVSSLIEYLLTQRCEFQYFLEIVGHHVV